MTIWAKTMQSIRGSYTRCVCLQETKGYIETLVGYFKQYTAWVKNSVSAERLTLRCTVWSANGISAVRVCWD